jgi:hypothetical protein
MTIIEKNATMAWVHESKGRNAIQINADSGNDRAFAKLRVLALGFETARKIANSSAGSGSFLDEKIEKSV